MRSTNLALLQILAKGEKKNAGKYGGYTNYYPPRKDQIVQKAYDLEVRSLKIVTYAGTNEENKRMQTTIWTDIARNEKNGLHLCGYFFNGEPDIINPDDIIDILEIKMVNSAE